MASWKDFLNRYGSRGPSEIDIARPRWYEEPLPVLRVIAGYLDNESGRYCINYPSLVKEREAAIQKLRSLAGAGSFCKIRIRIIDRLYHAMTEVGGMREHHKFMIIRLMAVIKEILKRNAIHLAAAGKLAQPDDIWFLTWSELFNIYEEGEC